MDYSNMSPSWRATRSLGMGLGAFLLLYLLVLGTYKSWLPLFAEFLIVKTPLKKCDLIVVSTGSYDRFLYALELIKKGYGEKLLLLGDERFKKSATIKSPLELAMEEALDEGVRDVYRHSSTSTLDDARAAKEMMTSLGLKSVIVISDRYNMRRASIIFNRVFRETSIDLNYAYSEQDAESFISPDRWWTASPTFLYVIKEWLKLPIDLYLLVTA